MSRPAVVNFDKTGMNIDDCSLRNLVGAQAKYMFTGIMHLGTKTIYFASLRPPENPKDDHYGTKMPLHTNLFPCMVLDTVIQPILHKADTTSHDQLASKVCAILGNGATADSFCGFALRFEEGKKARLAPTSRTLNPGYNGELEREILEAILVFLKPKLSLLGYDLEIAAARVNPDASQAARGKAVIPSNLFSALKGIPKIN